MYTFDTIDTPYAFYVADSLNDDVLSGDNAIKAANEHLAAKFGAPELLTFRANAIHTFDARQTTARSVVKDVPMFGPSAVTEYDPVAQAAYEQARREYSGLLASLRSHWDNSPEGRQSAMDNGI